MTGMYAEADQIRKIIGKAQKIVIIQADNPDGDSLGSALALEHILGDLGKEPYLYCGADMPTYLRYLQGWDRVSPELSKNFDASIIVDASTMSLLEKLVQAGYQKRLANRPCVVLDHHASVENVVPFADVILNDHKNISSAGELIYNLAAQLEWPLSIEAQACLMTAILGDTQGLSNQLARPETYRVMANMVEAGVNRPALEESRREAGKMQQEIFKYKARLIARTEFAADGRIAWVKVPQIEINEYSPLYNPGPLVQTDMLQTAGVQAAIVFKEYDDGRVTGAIRCNPTAGIAADLATRLGGGGHAFASGFKVTDGKSFDKVKDECLSHAQELLEDKRQA
jgi:phosphoesterase RecJ-like protein